MWGNNAKFQFRKDYLKLTYAADDTNIRGLSPHREAGPETRNLFNEYIENKMMLMLFMR